MTDSNRDTLIREMVEALVAEYREVGEAIKKLQLRRGRLRAAIIPLISIDNDEPAEFSGSLADACRFVLKTRDGSLSPQQVRDAVKAIGYDLGKHDNVMATIHGVLKSLEKQGVVKTKEWKKEPGVTRYYWAENPLPAADGSKGALERLAAIYQPSKDVLELLNLTPQKSSVFNATNPVGPSPDVLDEGLGLQVINASRIVRDDLRKQLEEDRKAGGSLLGKIDPVPPKKK